MEMGESCSNYEFLDVTITKLDMTDAMLSHDIKGFRKNFLDKLKLKAENTHGNLSLSKASFRQILNILYRSIDSLYNMNEELRIEYKERFNEEMADIGFMPSFSSFQPQVMNPPSESISAEINRPKTGSITSDVNSTHSPVSLHGTATDNDDLSKQKQNNCDSDSNSNSTIITKRKRRDIEEKVQNDGNHEDQEEVKNKSSDSNESDKSGHFPLDFSSIVIPSPPQTIKLIKKTQEQKQKENINDSFQQPKNGKVSIGEELQRKGVEVAAKIPVPFKTEINGDVLTYPDLNENDLEIIDEEVPGGSRSFNSNPESKNESEKNQNKNSKKCEPESTIRTTRATEKQSQPVVTKEDKRNVLKMLCSSEEEVENEVENKEKQKKKDGRAERSRTREKKKSQLVDNSGNQLCHKLLMKTQVLIPKFPKNYLKELKKKKYAYIHEPPPVTSSDESSSDNDEEMVRKAIKDLKRTVKETEFKKKKQQPKRKASASDAAKKKRKGRKRKNVEEMSGNLYSGSSSDSDVQILNPGPNPDPNRRNCNFVMSSESEAEYLSGNSDFSNKGGTFRKGFLDREGRKKKNNDNKKDTDNTKKKKKRVNLYVPNCAELYVDNSDSDDELFRNRRPKRNRVIRSDSDEGTTKKPRRERDKFSDDSDDIIFENEIKRTKTSRDDKEIEEVPIPIVPENIEEAPLFSQTHSRKNIREILDTDDLAKSTKVAQREEEERKKRLSKKNKLMITVSSAQHTVENLILDIDPKTKEPLVTVHPRMTEYLKSYQRKGVGFLWDSTIESVNSKRKEGNGCILAHCMGLGKSIQTIAYIHAVLNEDRLNLKKVLVVCPLATVVNWQQEFDKWFKNIPDTPLIFDLSMKDTDIKGSHERASLLQKWYTKGGVGIIHYQAFENLVHADPNPKKNRMKTTEEERKIFREALINPGPDIIICDEGHKLKNEKNQLSKALAGVVSRRRIVLTGTPLQNNLEEYYTMMNFVKPNFLGTLAEFRNRFVNPISNGQHKDSSAADVKLMKKRAHILHKMLDSSVQRLDYQILMPMLPAKEEYVIYITLSAIQMELYDFYLKNVAKVDNNNQTKIKERYSKGNFFKDFQLLQKIQAHPLILQSQLEKAKKLAQTKSRTKAGTSLASPLVEDISDDISDSSDIEWLDDFFHKIEKFKAVNIKKEVIDPSEVIIPDLTLPEEKEPTLEVVKKMWWEDILAKANIKENEGNNWLGLSGKFVVMKKILIECQRIGDKLVIFSSYTLTLDKIEEALKFMDQHEDFGRWQKNKDYFRIDGAISGKNRQKQIDIFNDPKSEVRLFIITKTAGGIGINLIGASRVIIFDCAWNPTHDQQSLYRLYRLGQVKPVFVYRFLSYGTMESNVYNRSVVKLSLSCRVVDEQQIERHFSNDIYEMYKCSPKDKPRTEEIPLVPNDKVFANILVEHRNWIDSYFAHDSLLENKVDEGLSEEERKAAWDEYKLEQSRKTDILDSGVLGNLYSQNLRVMLYENVKAQNPNEEPSEEYLDNLTLKFNNFKTEINLIEDLLTREDNIPARTTLEARKAEIHQLINSMVKNVTLLHNQNQQPTIVRAQVHPHHINNGMSQNQINPKTSKGNLPKSRGTSAQAKKTLMNKNARIPLPPLANMSNNSNTATDRQTPISHFKLKVLPPPLLTDEFSTIKRSLGNFVPKQQEWNNGLNASFYNSLNPSPNFGRPLYPNIPTLP